MTISFAPWRMRFFIRDANTGCADAGLAPMTMMTSVSSTESKFCVPAEVPKVWPRPYPVGEWQTRAQVSTLLLPNAARISFCTRKVSSLVQRDEVMPPTEFLPYFAWMRLNSEAAWLIASSQLTSFQGSVALARIIGLRMRSLWVA